MATTTSRRNFAFYRQKVYEWIETLGLSEYRLSFTHKDDAVALANGRPSRAYVMLTPPYAGFGLAKSWGNDEVTDRRIEVSAFHETMHLLLSPLVFLAYERYATKTQIDEEEERIIHRLETLMFGAKKNN